MGSTIQLELNEINFDYVGRYVKAGHLPNFARLMDAHGVAETVSEDRYEWLEPWIQWVTAHTGKSFEEHRVFRLGYIVDRPDLEQVWERLERGGKTTAAMSPMNARNAVSRSPFFVPDPWTDTKVTGGALITDVYAAIRQAVNENAQGRLMPGHAWSLVKGVLAGTRPEEMLELGTIAVRSMGAGWRRAIFLDVFLAALFLRLWEKSRPDYATLFLNAGAHIQHHYMFSSRVYEGPHRNPGWYVKPEIDPLLEIYTAYDRILGRLVQRCKGARLIIATGLHQDPEPVPIYYWRPRDHAVLLQKLQVPFQMVYPRMSRDFLIESGSADAAAETAERLTAIELNGKPVFSTDLRGEDVFVELVWPDALPEGSLLSGAGMPAGVELDLSTEVAFVALKNGRHNGIGYLIDTDTKVAGERRIPLTELAYLVD